MTAPREILPGETYMLTRCCTQREFLLRPDEVTNQIFEYCLAEAAERHDIGLIAWKMMSNHYHAVVYDRKGQLSDFLEHFHKMVAKCMNRRLGRSENFWATEETCVTRLVTAADIFEKVIYVLGNPVHHHLVDRVSDWPGSSSLRYLGGARTTEHERPTDYFAADGVMQPSVRLRTMIPPCISKRESAAAWGARVRAALAAREAELRKERLEQGKRVLGRKAVLRTSPFSRPTTPRPKSELRPAVACKDKRRRIEALRRLVDFYERYAEKRWRFINGDRDVVFPAGTVRLRKLGVRCAPYPLAA